jgi:DNA-binding transcriptional ArsR family regulator
MLAVHAIGAVIAGWTEQRFVAVATNPANLGGLKAQDRSDPAGYAIATYWWARDKIASGSPEGIAPPDITELCAAILIAASNAIWEPRTKGQQLAVLEAVVDLAHTHNKIPVSVSTRDLANRVGLSHQVVGKHLRLLCSRRWITRVYEGNAFSASKYDLHVAGRPDGLTPPLDLARGTSTAAGSDSFESTLMPTVSTSRLFPWTGSYSGHRQDDYLPLDHVVFDRRAYGKSLRNVLLALSEQPHTIQELAAAARLHRNTVSEKLQIAGNLGMARQTADGWVRKWRPETVTAVLDQAAKRNGWSSWYPRRRATYRAEQEAYRDRLPRPLGSASGRDDWGSALRNRPKR